jgi:Protein of unknown function (DUF3224)
VNASAAFTNDRYDEEPYGEAEGTGLSRVHISRTFTGDLEGESTAELLIAKSEGGGGYIGHDRINGILGGHSGGFVFQHGGIMGPEGVSNTGTIVPGTGSGGLEGISGDGTMLADEDGNHTLTLSYELPE